MRRTSALLLCLFLVSCGDDDPAGPSGPTSVSGTVTKGAVSASSVVIRAVNNDRSPGAIVAGPFTTDAEGGWSGEIPASKAGPYYIEATGGTYVDEASGVTVDLGTGSLMGYSSNGSGVVSPFTQMLYEVVGVADPSLSAAQAWQTAIAAFTPQFGFDPTTTEPALTGSTDQQSYMAALGGLSLLIDDTPALSNLNGVTLFEIILALIQDIADNSLNGVGFNGAIDIGGVTLPAVDVLGLGALVDACNQYADSVPELVDLLFGPIDLDFTDLTDPETGTGGGQLRLSGGGLSVLPNGASTLTPNFFVSSTSSYTWTGNTAVTSGWAMTIVETSLGGSSIFAVGFAHANVEVDYSWSRVFNPGEGLTKVGEEFRFSNATMPSLDAGVGDLTFDGELSPTSEGR